MELVWKEITPERLVCTSASSVLIEGVLPIPDGKIFASVLCCKAEASVSSVDIEADSAELSGSLNARVFALDSEGGVFAFDSEAEFSHAVEASGAKPGMKAKAKAFVKSINTQQEGSDLVFNAEIEIRLSVIDTSPLRVIDGISGAADLEVRHERFSNIKSVHLGSRTLKMREELTEAGILDVIASEGQVLIRETIPDGDGVSVSGVLTVSAVTSDSTGRIGSIFRQIPFRERLDFTYAQISEMYCTAWLKDVQLHALGEEFSLIAMEAEVAFDFYALERNEYMLPADAFSPTIGFDCLMDKADIIDTQKAVSAQIQVKDSINLPLSIAESALPLFASAQTIITGTEASDNETIVSGIFATSVICRNESGGISAYSDDVPFSLCIPIDPKWDNSFIIGSCSVQIISIYESSVQLNYNVLLEAEPFDIKTVYAVAGLAEKELPARKSGIIIAFASRGDTLFEVAKRYSVPTESIIKLNPQLSEPLSDGEKLLILV